MSFDGRSSPLPAADDGARSITPSHARIWQAREVDTLRSTYPSGGAAATHALLPHRSVSAIHGKAQTLGLRCTRPSTMGLRFARRYPASDLIDAAVREAYATAKRKGDLTRAARRIGRPAWWVHKRAAQLGVSRSANRRIDLWTADELALLEQWASCTLTVIRRKLAAAGFARTETGISIKLKRLRIDRDSPDHWSPPALAEVLGVNAATVVDWIERRGLPATKGIAGQQPRYTIHRRALRGWIRSHPRYIDLRKVDQTWFLDLVFGSAVT